MIVTSKELAACLGLSVRQVYRLQRDGIVKKTKDDSGYELEVCVPAYIDYKISSETGRKTAITKEQAQADHEKVKMEISKLKLSRLRRESLDARAVEAGWADMLTYFKNQLEALPNKMAMEIVGEDTNSTIQILDRMIKDVFDELARYDPKDVEDTDLDDFDEEDDEEEGDDE